MEGLCFCTWCSVGILVLRVILICNRALWVDEQESMGQLKLTYVSLARKVIAGHDVVLAVWPPTHISEAV